MQQTTTAVFSTSLEPQRLADIQAIRRLTHEYSRLVDTAQLEELLTLFTEDAEWDTAAFGMGVERGQGALREFFAGLIHNTQQRCHMAMNHRIDVKGDEASATVYLHAFVTMSDGRIDESVGYYADDYIRSDQGWKIRRRKANALLEPPEAPVQTE